MCSAPFLVRRSLEVRVCFVCGILAQDEDQRGRYDAIVR